MGARKAKWVVTYPVPTQDELDTFEDSHCIWFWTPMRVVLYNGKKYRSTIELIPVPACDLRGK